MNGSGLLLGKVALLSGVGEGLGRDTALLFAQHGARVALTARRPQIIDRVAAEIRSLGGECLAVRCDITRDEDCVAATRAAFEAFGAIHALVNIAYRSDYPQGYQRLEETDTELSAFRSGIEVNLLGTLRMTRAALPYLKAAGGAYIVMVNTMMAAMTIESGGPYSASKAALEKAAKTLALEVGRYGIRVNSIHPGYMDGPQTDFVFQTRARENGTTAQAERARVAAQIPLGYVPSTLEHAKAILFLASDLASAITGQSLHVNGGQWQH